MATLDQPGIAWITGAGSGIGRSLALALAARGWTVAISGRKEAALDMVAAETDGPGSIVPYPVDITNPEATEETVAAIERQLGAIDLAVLNAGTHVPVSAASFSRDDVVALIETNLVGTVNCLAALLPRFVARHGGEIAVTASMTGYRGLPTSAGYGATKAALINTCESLRPELERERVSLRLINPGFVDTPLTRLNRFPMPFLIDADRAAAIILRKLAGRRFEITVPWQMALLLKLLRLLPNRLALAVTRRVTPAAEDLRPGGKAMRGPAADPAD